jgi:hypothetical protein
MLFSRHLGDKNTVEEIRLIDCDLFTAKLLALEFDLRDFENGAGQRKSEVLDGFLGTDLKVTLVKEGSGDPVPDKNAIV